MIKKILSLALSASLVISTTGCASQNVNEEEDDKLKIVTSFYPMYLLTKEITKDIDNVEVINLVGETTGCLHDYSLTTDNLKLIENSDVLVVNGAGMENFIEKVVKSNDEIKIIDSSKNIELIESCHEHDHDHDHEEGEEHEDHEEHDGHEEEHADHEEHEEHEEGEEHAEHEDHEGHDHSINSHIWLDPENVMTQAHNIVEEIKNIDSENSEKYNENLDEFKAELSKLDTDFEEAMSTLENKNMITFHEAFSYLANAYDLNIVATIQQEEGVEPSAKEIQETIELAKEHSVSAIFIEPQYNAKTAQIIADETDAKTYTLDPAVTNENDESYIEIMYRNMEVLKEALK